MTPMPGPFQSLTQLKPPRSRSNPKGARSKWRMRQKSAFIHPAQSWNLVSFFLTATFLRVLSGDKQQLDLESSFHSGTFPPWLMRLLCSFPVVVGLRSIWWLFSFTLGLSEAAHIRWWNSVCVCVCVHLFVFTVKQGLACRSKSLHNSEQSVSILPGSWLTSSLQGNLFSCWGRVN